MTDRPSASHTRHGPPPPRRDLDDPLRAIAAGLDTATGADFFDQLVAHLSQALDIELALVGELTEDRKHIRTLSVYRDGGIETPFTYALDGTPCEDVLNASTCAYPRDVHGQFPQDALLESLGVESYVGTTLTARDGTPLGLMAVMDRRPLDDPEMAAYILEIFASRAAAELERAQAQAALQAEHDFREKVLDHATNAIYAIDTEGRFTLVNRAGARLIGRETQELIGQPYSAVLPEDERPRMDGLFREIVAHGRTVEGVRTTIVRPSGARRALMFNAAPLYEGGRPVGAVGTAEDITDRLHAEDAQRRSEEYLGAIIDNEPECVKLVSPDGVVADVNAAGLAMLEADDASDVIGRAVLPFVAPEYHGAFQDMSERVLRGEPSMLEFEVVGLKGTRRCVETRAVRLASDENRYRFVLAITRDITDRRRAEAERAKLSSVVEQAADAIFITDRRGVVEYVNPAFERITGYTREEVTGETPRILDSGMHDAAFFQRLWQTLESGETFRDVFVNRRRDGSLYTEDKTISPLKDADGHTTHYISTGQDITEQREIQDRARYLAYNDALTDLPNRALLIERLGHALARARWTNRRPVMLMLGLDRFKLINESLGHEAGDQVLRAVARRLTECVREGDTVARLSGDAFAVLLEDVAVPEDVPYIINKIRDALSRAMVIDDQECFVTTTIGVSVHPDDGDDVAMLLRNADTAMFRAKERGRDTYQFYSPGMSAKALERLTLETDLRHALERDELRLHYQPQVDLRDGRVVGAEALLRWQHPTLGMISPGVFIPVAEETGLIVPIGEWVMRQACEQARAWAAAGLGPLRIAVNLSGRQLNHASLAKGLRGMLQQAGVDAAWLALEVTESMIMEDAQTTLNTLRELSEMGVELAIDDFGTGYSSLSYLKRFPIHTLKIDKSFVDDLDGPQPDASIVSAIVAMAHSLELRVIAEGVETDAQLARLRERGCDAMQGFLFSRPLPEREVTGLIRAAP